MVDWSEAEAVSVWIYSSLEIKLIDYQLTLEDGYLHMLLHLNEDFEDDLLQDCIALLQ
jgi:hypothetical protein